MMQFDLFSSRTRPPSTPVAWFPVRHRRSFITAIARTLLQREGEKRAKRLRLECNRLYADMIVVGIRDEAVIAAELADFRVAVESEMRRQVVAAVLFSKHQGDAA